MNRIFPIRIAPFCLALLFVAHFHVSQAQERTVGLFFNTQASFDGYTLFAPMTARNTYLINNCGYEVHRWNSNFTPGLAAYLREDGALVRTARIPSSFNSGGSGGRVEIISWEGDLEWASEYSTDTTQQHHDIDLMPNGNILLIAWELFTEDEAIAAGRDPDAIVRGELWGEQIVELKPIGEDSAEIVWMWRLWDHLVQDFDSTKANYVEDVRHHPGRVDINYLTPNGLMPTEDWIHLNSVDYNPELDQVLVSSRSLSEIWIVDHSTTLEEAATDTGGVSGKGGDLLFRWGNPEAYGRGTAAERKLYSQHDARWIEQGKPDAGKITVYNNGVRRPQGNYSSVDMIEPMWNTETKQYDLLSDSTYAPPALAWTFTGDGQFDFFSSNVSGASQMPNGNVLVCIGSDGRFIEVNGFGNMVWDYVNPVSAGNPTVQGNPVFSNNVFKIERYPVDYAAFDGRNLEPGDLIELSPIPDECELFKDTSTSVYYYPFPHEIQLLENPVIGEEAIILNPINEDLDCVVIESSGRLISHEFGSDKLLNLDLSGTSAGIYFVVVRIDRDGRQKTFKLIRH